MADSTKEHEGKSEYLVREGKVFGVNQLQAGESVWLSDAEAAAFADLVEPRDKKKKSDQNTDTRDTAKNEANIGDKLADTGTAKKK